MGRCLMSKPIRILVLDDSDADVRLMLAALAEAELPCQCDVAVTGELAISMLMESRYDVILAEHALPLFGSSEILALRREHSLGAPVIVVSGPIGEQATAELMRSGAVDFVLKTQLQNLSASVLRVLREKEERRRRMVIDDRYRDLVEHSHELICTHDLDGQILSFNQGSAKLLGYDQSDFVNQSISDLLAPEVRDQFDSYLERIRREGAAKGLMLVQARSGEKRIWEYHNTLRTEGVESPIVRGMAYDITELKGAERRLREAEARYRDLFENANDMIYTHDLAGTVTSANKKAEQMLGYGADDLVGMNVSQLVALEGEETPGQRLLDRLSELTQSTTYEAELIARDGAGVPVEVSSRLMYEKGKPVGIQAIARDISERRLAEQEHLRLEEQLLHAQKMESVGRLAGGVAHDFNNLLTAIIGYSQLLLGRLDAASPMRHEVDQILRAGQRAASLTEQLLTFSRRQRLEPKRINLNDTIADVMTMLRRLIGADVEVVVQIDPGLPSVLADRVHVEQVLMNLAVNARDAMPQGGSLVIQTHALELDDEYCRTHSWARPGKFAEIRVSDLGEGMDAATVQHIFEPFYTTKELGKGTGLGLAVVYGIIQQHDGLVHVASAPGEGTSFRILLPACAGAAEKTVDQAEPPLRGGTETILIAEDEEALRKLAAQLLSELGYTVLLASDGEEALRMYKDRGGEIDLMLLDIVMPRMSGRQVYEWIRKQGSGTPAIFISGYVPEGTRVSFADELSAPLIQKPYSIGDLGRKVREVLDKGHK